jgi:hypothetical protein
MFRRDAGTDKGSKRSSTLILRVHFICLLSYPPSSLIVVLSNRQWLGMDLLLRARPIGQLLDAATLNTNKRPKAAQGLKSLDSIRRNALWSFAKSEIRLVAGVYRPRGGDD